MCGFGGTSQQRIERSKRAEVSGELKLADWVSKVSTSHSIPFSNMPIRWLLAFSLVLAITSCKNTVVPTQPIIPSTCDTCRIDLGHGHISRPGDTTSHNFRWIIYSLPKETSIANVKVTPAGEVFVMGRWLYQLKGNSFVDVAPTDPQPLGGSMDRYSLFMVDYSNYWLIGGGFVNRCYYHTASSVPEVYTASSGLALSACWGMSGNDMFAVGDNGTIIHFDGNSWSKMVSNTTKSMFSIWGTSDSNIWACGNDLYNNKGANTVLMHYDGTSWSEDPLSLNQGYAANIGFNNVWAVDTGGIQYAFTSGRTMMRQRNLDGWYHDTAGIPSGVLDRNESSFRVNGATLEDIWVSGQGYLSHWNGASWYQYVLASNLQIQSVSTNGDIVCAVGTLNGTGWAAVGYR